MLKGRNAVVTGSTRGIGRGIAQALAAQGCNVMLNGFGDPADIEALRTGLEQQHHVTARYHGADMSKPDECAALIAATHDIFGGVDVLIFREPVPAMRGLVGRAEGDMSAVLDCDGLAVRVFTDCVPERE